MAERIIFCLPVRVAAILESLTVLLISGVGAAAGWYSLYSLHHTPGLSEMVMRTQYLAGVLGAFASCIFAVSLFGFLALITKRRALIRHYLWTTWITFFVAVVPVVMFAILLWMKHDAWGYKYCVIDSAGDAKNCRGPPLWAKILASVVAMFGMVIQLHLTVVIRLHYAEFQYEKVDNRDWTQIHFDSSVLPNDPHAIYL